MITVEKLIQCGVAPTQAKVFAPFIAIACDKFHIATSMQRAAFISQTMHESAGFTHLEENLYYSKPEVISAAFKRLRPLGMGVLAKYCKNPQGLGNLAYANINGNGDESSGDGWRYRARGLIGLTGQANYMVCGSAAGKDYKGRPELVSQPEDASLSAGWFWASAGLNEIAAQNDIEAVTFRINGGYNGLADRQHLYMTCLEVML